MAPEVPGFDASRSRLSKCLQESGRTLTGSPRAPGLSGIGLDGARVIVGLDGARWIVEMTKSRRYHIIDRWSPPADDPVYGLGTALMITFARFKLLYEDVD